MEENVKDIIEKAKNIAVIGCSKKPGRASCRVAGYLQRQGYRIIPVHPQYDEVLGEKTYPTVYDIPEDIQVDIVDIFRRSDHTAAMVDQVIRRKEQTGQEPVVWTQLNVSSDEARQKAKNAGLVYIENKCLMVEHQKLHSRD